MEERVGFGEFQCNREKSRHDKKSCITEMWSPVCMHIWAPRFPISLPGRLYIKFNLLQMANNGSVLQMQIAGNLGAYRDSTHINYSETELFDLERSWGIHKRKDLRFRKMSRKR